MGRRRQHRPRPRRAPVREEPDETLPAAVVFRPACCGQGWLWAWPVDQQPVDPARLGLSERLLADLADWYDAAPSTGVPSDTDRGLALAYRLQQEVVAAGLDVEVVWGMGDQPVPVWEHRGR